MAPGSVFVGLDLNDAGIRTAFWNAGARRAEPLDAAAAGLHAFDVGFRRSSDRRAFESIFPVPAGWRPDRNGVLFKAVRHHLPSFREPAQSGDELQQAIALPALEYFRRQIAFGEVHASLAVPLEYMWDNCAALERSAHTAGFATCRSIAEPLAALLAYLPKWRDDPILWKQLAAGRGIWVVESRYWDLLVALIDVRHSPTSAKDRLEFTVLAGDCLEHFGAMARTTDDASLAGELRASVSRIMATTWSQPWTAETGSRPPLERANWIVGSGDGPFLETAVAAIAAELPGTPLVGDLSPNEIVASGAAVHSAIAGDQLPYRLSIARRSVLGVKVAAEGGLGFEPLVSASDEVPVDFERAFLIPGQLHDAPVEITVAAGLPGGDRCGALHTFVVAPQDLSRRDRAVLLVDGRLETAAEGRVRVRDAHTDKTLGQAEFRLL